MIQRGTAQYYARMFIPAEEGGFFHRHHQGAELAVPEGIALGAEPLVPFVNEGRWVVKCPSCGGAQLAAPEMDRFFCVDCLNRSTDGQWLPVAWHDPQAVSAIEAALVARPHLPSRNWHPAESVGALVAENHFHGLVDVEAERVAGDIGFDHDWTALSHQRAIRSAE